MEVNMKRMKLNDDEIIQEFDKMYNSKSNLFKNPQTIKVAKLLKVFKKTHKYTLEKLK